jgi:putative endonuclease
MYFVYALNSQNRNYIYVGLTSDVDRRIAQHNNGFERTTKPYLPFKLILVESFETRPEARIREIYLKSTSGKRFLRGLIGNNNLD